MVSESTAAGLAALSVTISLPFFLYGAWYAIETEVMTWDRLMHHLKFVITGLVLTTAPMVLWMMPRLPKQFGGVSALHAFFGLQAYALLVLALTGIVRIFQAKRQADLYRNPDPDADIGELHENMAGWRRRLRIGVFGYLILWILAYLLGVYQYVTTYVL